MLKKYSSREIFIVEILKSFNFSTIGVRSLIMGQIVHFSYEIFQVLVNFYLEMSSFVLLFHYRIIVMSSSFALLITIFFLS